MTAAAQQMSHSQRWTARFDDGRHGRARIGFVLIATERNIEHEMMRLAPAGVGMHFSRVTPEYLLEFAKAIDRPDADAIFISCGALRTLDVIQAVEDAVGKPAICSNQAMLWHCLRLAGIDDRISGFGRLMLL